MPLKAKMAGWGGEQCPVTGKGFVYLDESLTAGGISDELFYFKHNKVHFYPAVAPATQLYLDGVAYEKN